MNHLTLGSVTLKLPLVVDDDGTFVFVREGGLDGPKVAEVEDRQTAHLFAASPDLLLTVEDLMRRIEHANTVDPILVPADVNVALGALSTIVARARRQEPK